MILQNTSLITAGSDYFILLNFSGLLFSSIKFGDRNLLFLAHLAKGKVSFCHHLASVVR